MRARRLALGQGLFYVVTGVWPLLSIRSFEAVTGPKTDRWLVKTVGVLIAVIGTTLTLAGRRRRVPDEIALLAASSAASLGAVDTVYALRGRISRVYLLDAIVEAALVAAWLGVGMSRAGRGRRRPGQPSPARRGRRLRRDGWRAGSPR